MAFYQFRLRAACSRVQKMSRQGKASRLPVRAQWRRITHEADVHSRSFRWRVPVYQLSTARSGDAGLRSGPCEFRRRGGHKGCSCTSGCAQDHASNGTPRTSPILSEPKTHIGQVLRFATRRSATPRSNVINEAAITSCGAHALASLIQSDGAAVAVAPLMRKRVARAQLVARREIEEGSAGAVRDVKLAQRLHHRLHAVMVGCDGEHAKVTGLRALLFETPDADFKL
jgi:hypothetical protein